MTPNREMKSDQVARPAAEAIASALARWTHDCNRVGYGVIECGGCGVELNGFASRDGNGMGDDIHLTLRQKGWLVVTVAEVAEAKESWLALQAENERLRETIREAAGNLCMTQCPAYTDNGVCASGCYSEPSCQTDEPTEGWIVAALNLLVPDEDESPDETDEQEAPGK